MDIFGRDSSGNQSSTPELHLILLGNIGCGKTLTADTLLNDSSSISALMPSRLSEVRRGVSEGRHLKVVETPRWYWTGKHIEGSVQKETEKALSLVEPGPHAFIILVPVGQFTEMEGRIPAELQRVFGRDVLKHTLVLLTCGDYLAGRDHDRYVRTGEPGLSEMVNECGGRWHVINNRRPEDRKQVISLLEKVEQLTKMSGGCYLPSPMQRQINEGMHEKERELTKSYSLREEELVHQEHSTLSQTAWSKEETWDESGKRKIRVRSMGPATGRVMSQQLANGLPSQTWYDDTSAEVIQKRSSFKLSKEGAILSQMSETDHPDKNLNNQNFINTIHYNISTMGDTSSAPTSIPPPTASYSPSFKTFSSSSYSSAAAFAPSSSSSSSTLPSSPTKALSSSFSTGVSSSPTNATSSSSSTNFSSSSSSTLPSSPTKATSSTLPSFPTKALSSSFSTGVSSSPTNATSSSSSTNFSSSSSSTLPSSPTKATSSTLPSFPTKALSSSFSTGVSSSPTNATSSSSSTNFSSSSSSTLPSSPTKATSSSSTLPSSPTKALSSSFSTGVSSSPTKATSSSSSTSFSSSSPYTNTSFSPSYNALSVSSSTQIASSPTSSSFSSSSAFSSVSPNTKASVFSPTTEVSSFPSTNASLFSSSNTISSSSHSSTYASSLSSSTALSPISTNASSFFSSDSSDELRLVLMGRTGSGKSAAGNAILGRDEFNLRRDDSTGATTHSCVKGTAVIGKKRVTVVDTPDWFWPPENMATHLSSCMDLCAPGPHAFLLCVPVTLPGRSNLHDLSSLKNSFGPDDIQHRTLVLFTHSDKLKDGNVEEYIAAKRPELLELVEKCEDRFHVLKQGKNEGNIGELLEKVEQAVKESGGSHYSCQGQGEEVGREKMTQLRRGRGVEDDIDRANSGTLHSLREEEEVEQEEKNANTLKSTASSVASVLSSVLRFVGQKVGQGAQQVPKPVAGGAVLGGVLGLYFGGPIGGAVGATAGSAAAEYGRRKYNKPKTD